MKLQVLSRTGQFLLGAAAAVMLLGSAANASPIEPGKPAPDFKAQDIEGKEVTLSGLKGKVVVLEWNNPGCPFVKKHYSSDHMQTLQKTLTAKGVVWLTINSSSLGKQGSMSADEAKAQVKEWGAAPTHYILDPSGDIGHLYEAKTTPHMFVINKDGTIAYMGAIDSIASVDPEDIAKAHDYITDAVDSIEAGKMPAVQQSQPYGCSIKYAE